MSLQFEKKRKKIEIKFGTAKKMSCKPHQKFII